MSKSKRNLIAKDLRENDLYRMKVVAARKGKGSYKRKEKHGNKIAYNLDSTSL